MLNKQSMCYMQNLKILILVLNTIIFGSKEKSESHLQQNLDSINKKEKWLVKSVKIKE